MTAYANPTLGTSAIRNGDSAGEMTLNRFMFDLADAAYKPATLGIGDTIQIGVVPAGSVLCPWLCRVDIPILDTDGSPLGQASIGTAASAASLKAAGVLSAAQILTGEDFLNATIGSQTDDVAIYLKFTVAVVAVQTTGKIIANLVSRAWDQAIDG